jgi:type II secretory pathway pseudopilin PulG
MSHAVAHRGFTLVETVVAAALLITVLAGLAQLLVMSSRLTRGSAAASLALMAAQDAIETLRALPFGVDAVGQLVTAAELGPSPPTSLMTNTPPFVDWIDADGVATQSPATAQLVRRWQVSRVGEGADLIAIEVCVFTVPATGAGPSSALSCLATVRTRQP